MLGVLLAVTIALTLLGMVQLDRVWGRLGELQRSQARLEEAIIRLEQRAAVTNPAGAAAAVQTSLGQDAWAVPGVPIVRSPRPDWINDPRGQPGFTSGGTITEAIESELATLTPYIGATAAARRINELVIERLADYHPATLQMQGVLAEAWQIDPDRRWLRVKVRDNAVWSDGEPVTAGDIRFTIDFLADTRINAIRFRATYSGIGEVRVISEKVAEFRFVEPVYINVDAALRLPVLAEHVYSAFPPEQYNTSTGLVFGSGPYRLAELDAANQWVPGRPIELVRNPRHTGRSPAPDTMRFVVMTSPQARLAAIDNGEVDLIRSSADQYTAVSRRSGNTLQLFSWPCIQSGPHAIIWNCGARPDGKPTPFADRRVRLAMTHAIDRERLGRDFFEGLSGPVPTGPFSPTTAANDPAIAPWPFDMKRAGELLDEAGWKQTADGTRRDPAGNPLRFSIMLQRSSEKLAALLRDQFGALGAECTTIPFDNAEQALKAHDFDGIVYGWSPDSPEVNPYQRFHSASITGGGDNSGQWATPEADALIAEARRTMDPAQRDALWRKFHAIVHAEQPYTYLYARPWFTIASPRIGNIVPYPMGLLKAEMFVRSSP